MKAKIFQFYLVFLVTVLFACHVSAVPKYTDKETALKLARILDESVFGRYTVTSTYVQNDDISHYYISVILSDGSIKKWYINQIYKWCRDDRLILSENRALLFLDSADSHFVILNKNEFHRMALKANVFVKEYLASDPLDGKQFRFRIKEFSLISTTETAFGRNKEGSKYRYIVDLYNGTRELMTYEDAYRIQKHNRLLTENGFSEPTFERAYHVTRIIPHSKGGAENGVSQFGVELLFNQAIQMDGNNFPFTIYERKQYDRRTKMTKKEFVMDITIPNSEEKYNVKPIRNLEYLYNIHIVKDPKHPKRLILRTSFNPSVMDIPPIVYKNGANSIYVNFFNLVDQSVLSRGMLLESEHRKAAERKTFKRIKISRVIKKDSDYSRAFVTAVESHKESQSIKGSISRIRKLLESIKLFEEAALLAEKDKQLYSALMQRNKLRNTVIVLSLDFVKTKLATEDVASNDVYELTGLLDQAESFTRNQQVLKNIDRLREKIGAIK